MHGRPLRVVGPSLIVGGVIVSAVAILDVSQILLNRVGIALPGSGDAAFSTGLPGWLTNPSSIAIEEWADLAWTAVVVIALGTALGFWWDRARAEGRRSKLVSALVVLALLIGLSVIGGTAGFLVGAAAGGGEMLRIANLSGAFVGAATSLLISWLLLKSKLGMPVVANSEGSPYVTGTTELPGSVARAVDTVRDISVKGGL